MIPRTGVLKFHFLLTGPRGGVKVESIWDEARLFSFSLWTPRPFVKNKYLGIYIMLILLLFDL